MRKSLVYLINIVLILAFSIGIGMFISINHNNISLGELIKTLNSTTIRGIIDGTMFVLQISILCAILNSIILLFYNLIFEEKKQQNYYLLFSLWFFLIFFSVLIIATTTNINAAVSPTADSFSMLNRIQEHSLFIRV